MSEQTIEGVVAFSHVTEHDVYNGQSTGKYSMTITLPDEAAQSLSEKGVKIKEYDNDGEILKQRKFTSKFDLLVVDAENNPFRREVNRGSKVRLRFKLGPEHPVHGVSTYLNAVRVLEEAEEMASEAVDF
jgi:hypothetical protein